MKPKAFLVLAQRQENEKKSSYGVVGWGREKMALKK